MSRHASDTRPFSFKQFQLSHHQSTMKVGIDATILGIWTEIQDQNQVLDVGCGCGVVSLLLASRACCFVTAIDIDQPSVTECTENFACSPYSDRLLARHTSLQTFGTSSGQFFDRIVSNPPFFTTGSASENWRLGQARHTKSLTYNDLITYSFSLLKPDGRFTVVLPYSSRKRFIEESRKSGFYLIHELLIFPLRGMPPNRIYLSFAKHEAKPFSEMLNLREENRQFTNEYSNLVKDFLLW